MRCSMTSLLTGYFFNPLGLPTPSAPGDGNIYLILAAVIPIVIITIVVIATISGVLVYFYLKRRSAPRAGPPEDVFESHYSEIQETVPHATSNGRTHVPTKRGVVNSTPLLPENDDDYI